MKNATQLNVTMDAEVVKEHKVATAIADSNLQESTEAALCFFYGSNDPEILKLRERAVAAADLLRKANRDPFVEAPCRLTTATA